MTTAPPSKANHHSGSVLGRHLTKQEILIQAYSFTSAPIAKALVEAKQRGVRVEAILDKSNDSRSASGGTYSGAKFLLNAGIPVWIDYQPAIAHQVIPSEAKQYDNR